MNYKRNSEKYFWLKINIYKYIVANIILLDSIVCILPENKMFMVSFPSSILK